MKPPLRASLIAWPIRLAPPFRGDEPLLAGLLSNQVVTRPVPACDELLLSLCAQVEDAAGGFARHTPPAW